MSRHLLLSAVFIGVFLSQAACASQPAGFWQNPVIKDSGDIHPLPNGAFQPEKGVTYKAVFVISSGVTDEDKKNAGQVIGGFYTAARAVNIFASAGVPLDHLKFVVILHSGATAAALDNAHYKKEFGVNNPNLKVIKELETAGVQVAVCGQALAGDKYQDSWVNPDVKIALSALSTSIILQQQGYALVSM